MFLLQMQSESSMVTMNLTMSKCISLGEKNTILLSFHFPIPYTNIKKLWTLCRLERSFTLEKKANKKNIVLTRVRTRQRRLSDLVRAADLGNRDRKETETERRNTKT